MERWVSGSMDEWKDGSWRSRRIHNDAVSRADAAESAEPPTPIRRHAHTPIRSYLPPLEPEQSGSDRGIAHA
jgi:hypothetical protein